MTSIRWKLMATSLVLVFVPVFALNKYAITAFDRFTRKVWEEQMVATARMAGEVYLRAQEDAAAGEGGLDEETCWEICRRFSAETETRIRVLAVDGALRFDSSGQDREGTSFADLAEVAEALKGNYKARWEATEDNSYVYYHCAQPLILDGQKLGAIYVSRHTGPIIRAIKKMQLNQQIAMWVALLIAGGVAYWLAGTLTGRLRELTTAATSYARGETSEPVKMKGHDEIGKLARAFNNMADEIAQRQRYNKEFVSTTFHELKTPITAIRGAAELLEQGADAEKASRKKFVGNIVHEANRLDRLVSDLNDLSRLDVETQRGTRELIHYPQLIREIWERLEPVFDADEHAQVILDLPVKHVYVSIMPSRVEQVITNLLENAFRYTPKEGRVVLGVKTEKNNTVVTSVKDTGPGIPESNIGQVFDRFYTTEAPDDARDYGSGLGLSIARSIVENHHGRIWVKSKEGEGTTFYFSLPETKI